ncbi:MAG: TetR family transcriptional regulator [Methylomarinum sp.]|nr:TetR family transcriptional regulator [Methylomarinum sp.]
MKTQRNPENTRNRIIQAAFQEMHKHGYQGMRIDKVLKNTDLKKGAMYHHFPSKQVLGYAVLEERIQKRITEIWITPLKTYTDPLEGIHSLFVKLDEEWSDDFFNLGCPLNNLAQEMSPIDEGFRTRIETFFKYWKTAISEALEKGQQQGIVDKAINHDDCAQFILCALEGTLGMVKNHQSKAVFYSCGRELERYLNSLRTA